MGNIKTNEVLNNLKFKIIFKKHNDLINLELFSKNLRNKTHLNGVWEQMILNNSKISFRNIKNHAINVICRLFKRYLCPNIYSGKKTEVKILWH